MNVTKLKFNSQQYHQMAEAGIFEHIPTSRIELIKGEVVQMSPIGRKHCACLAKLNQLMVREFIDRFIIWGQSSIKLDDGSEPQPDLAVLRFRSDFYDERLPTASDILLIVEVADSTISYDSLLDAYCREVKIPLYAEFGIPEAWLLDVNRNLLTKFTQPSLDGYRIAQILDLADSIIFSGLKIQISDIFVS
jgi:Uma2 family endonuclease